jgi:hypothetical protein
MHMSNPNLPTLYLGPITWLITTSGIGWHQWYWEGGESGETQAPPNMWRAGAWKLFPGGEGVAAGGTPQCWGSSQAPSACYTVQPDFIVKYKFKDRNVSNWRQQLQSVRSQVQGPPECKALRKAGPLRTLTLLMADSQERSLSWDPGGAGTEASPPAQLRMWLWLVVCAWMTRGRGVTALWQFSREKGQSLG